MARSGNAARQPGISAEAAMAGILALLIEEREERKKGDKDAALRELDQIVKAHPDFGPAYYQLYRLYRERKDIGKSREAQQAHARIQAKERELTVRKLLLEVRQRGGGL